MQGSWPMSPSARSSLLSFLALYVWIMTIPKTGFCSASGGTTSPSIRSSQDENEALKLRSAQVSAHGKLQSIGHETRPFSDHSTHTPVFPQSGLKGISPRHSSERLKKRQEDLIKRVALKFHYSCTRSQRTSMTFRITIDYAHQSNLVRFLRTGHTQYVIHPWQHGINPIEYGGQLACNKCIRYQALRISCLYHYTGYMEGEVYPFDHEMFYDFIQNTGELQWEPKVTERCFTVGPNGEQIFSGPAQECTVFEVEGFVDDQP